MTEPSSQEGGPPSLTGREASPIDDMYLDPPPNGFYIPQQSPSSSGQSLSLCKAPSLSSLRRLPMFHKVPLNLDVVAPDPSGAEDI